MSNMIKAYSVRYDEEVTKTIDAHQRLEHKFIFNHRQNHLTSDGFVEGIDASVVELVNTQEEMEEKSVNIVEEAKNEAARLLEQAKDEAERIKNDAYITAQKQGYEAGIEESNRKLQKLMEDYDNNEKQRQAEYAAVLTELEPKMVDIMTSLIEKITGVMVEDKEDVIYHLVEQAFKNIDKCNEYTIKVAKDDYEIVSSKKEMLLDSIGRDVSLYITEDPALQKNQCMIETDYSVINCSLDVQLNNLITDMKLLAASR